MPLTAVRLGELALEAPAARAYAHDALAHGLNGVADQIDVEFTVEEQPSGAISATFGYAQDYGAILGLSYQESNVFGSGNSLNFRVTSGLTAIFTVCPD